MIDLQWSKHSAIQLVQGVSMPANIMSLVGYEGNSNHVGIYWDGHGDLMYEDGVDSVCGMLRPNVYSIWLASQPVDGFFNKGDIGSSSCKSNCMLIFGIGSGQLYIASISQGREFLEAQARKQKLTSSLAKRIPRPLVEKALAGKLDPADFKSILQNLLSPNDPSSISQRLNATRVAFEEMTAWVDGLSNPQGGPATLAATAKYLH